MNLFLCRFFLFFLFIASGSFTNIPEHGLQEKRTEIINEKYTVEWQANFDEKTIEFLVQAKTEGFVGFGLSTSGIMTGADIVIGGVNPDGSQYFNDYHGTTNGMPTVDSKKSWELIKAEQVDGVTSLRFKRDLDTCDENNQDIQITAGTLKIIWAIGKSDKLEYHDSNRGALAVNILDPALPPIDLSKFDNYNMTMGLQLDGVETRYWYTVERRTATEISHIVAVRPKLETEEALNYTHHFNIFFCKAPPNENADEFFAQWYGKPPFLSFTEDSPMAYCTTSLYAWSFGGKVLVFPEDIGFPWGFETNEYFLFEVHVNNPKLESGINFDSGVTFYSTKEKRPKEAGLFWVSADWNSALLIPPSTNNWTLTGHCSSDCTAWTLPDKGIQLLNINLHAHLSGRKMRIRHFRGRQELPWIANDNTYDFDYQENRPMNNEVQILPGDHMSIECTFDSSWKNGAPVVGGPSSSDEMCMAFLYYYPRAPLEVCESTYPLQKLYSRFQIEEVEVLPDFDVVVKAPEHLAGKTFTEILRKTEWTNEMKDELKKELRFSAHESRCFVDDSKPAYYKTPKNNMLKLNQPKSEINMTIYPEIDNVYEEPFNCNSEGYKHVFQLDTILFCVAIVTRFAIYF